MRRLLILAPSKKRSSGSILNDAFPYHQVIMFSPCMVGVCPVFGR
jgi:hypothetical protein